MKNYSVSSKIASCFAGECVGFLVGLASGISRRPALGWPFTISQEERLSYGFGSPRSLGGLVISLRLGCVDGWAFCYSSANGGIASCFAGEVAGFLVGLASGVSRRLALGWPLAASQKERLSYCVGSPCYARRLVISLRLGCVDGWAFCYSSANGEITSCFAGGGASFLVGLASGSASPLGFWLAFHHKPRRTLVLWFRLTPVARRLVISLRLGCVDGWAFCYSSANGGIASCFAGRGAGFLVDLASGGLSPLGFGLAFHHKPRRTLVLWFRLTPVAWRLRDLTGNWVCRWLGVLLFIRQWGNRFLLCGRVCGLSSS